jgi:hypothetical protein
VRSRRRIAVVAALVVLAGAVEAHHAMPMDMHAMAAAAVCLGVLGVAVIATVAIGAALMPAWGRAGDWSLPVTQPLEVRGVAARAGPARFLRLRMLRR